MISKKESQAKSKKQQPDLEPDTLEMEKRREKDAFLNLRKGVFAQEADGLNRTGSVFDRTAVFHVGSD